jgi:hypothetical protein
MSRRLLFVFAVLLSHGRQRRTRRIFVNFPRWAAVWDDAVSPITTFAAELPTEHKIRRIEAVFELYRCEIFDRAGADLIEGIDDALKRRECTDDGHDAQRDFHLVDEESDDNHRKALEARRYTYVL